MKRLSLFVMMVMLGSTPFAAGCGAEVEDDTAEASDEAKAASFAGDIKGVKLYNGEGATFAAPDKVAAVLENIGLEPGAKKPREGGLRCLPMYSLELLDAKGKVAATASFVCGAKASRKNVEGSIQINGKSYLIKAKDLDAIDRLAKQPLAVGDYLFSADAIHIRAPMDPKVDASSSDAKDVAKLAAAMDGDAVPNAKAGMPRCPPERVVEFSKGKKILASVSVQCQAGAKGMVAASFLTGSPLKAIGGIQIDAGVVFAVEKALSK